MDTHLEVHIRRIADLEIHIEKLKKEHGEEKSKLLDDLDLERERVLQL